MRTSVRFGSVATTYLLAAVWLAVLMGTAVVDAGPVSSFCTAIGIGDPVLVAIAGTAVAAVAASVACGVLWGVLRRMSPAGERANATRA